MPIRNETSAAIRGKGGIIGTAPVMARGTGTGLFAISEYNPALVYTATNVSGGGTATLNTTTGVYTVSAANSRWSIVARYAPGLPASPQGFMERKAYTYTCNYGPSYQHAWINATPGACGNDGTGDCGYCGNTGYNCQHQSGTNVKNSTPPTYNDSYSEWWKIT